MGNVVKALLCAQRGRRKIDTIFARQQAIELSGLSSGQLSRLDKAGIVRPQKLGSKAHPTVLYTLNQVLELRTIAALRQKLSMQELRKVIDHLREHKFEPTLFDKFLIFCNEELYWITFNELSEAIVKLSGKNKGQIVLKAVHPIGDVISGLEEEVKRREAAVQKRSPVSSTK
jgi:DNA-binding transcriptional MerR regulator